MAIRSRIAAIPVKPRRRQLLVVGIAGLVAVVSVGLFAVGRSNSPADSEGTAWERVLSQIGPDGDVSFETALAAFSIAVGPLPGVPMPSGPVRRISSGTGAIRWLEGYRSRLTDEQRAAVDRYLAPDPDAIVVEPDTTGVGGVELAAYRMPASTSRTEDARTPQEEQLLRYLDDARGEIARRLGRKLGLRYTLAINDTQETVADAYTLPHFGLTGYGGPSGCEFRVNPSMLEPDWGEPEHRATMAHEMFHCFQAAGMSGRDQWNSTHAERPWLIEGSAAWVGETVGGPSKAGIVWWDRYLVKPETPLFKREYTAIGFYLHMVERGVDPWLHLDKMMYTTNESAYHEGADPGGDAFLDTWASGHVRDRLLGGAWMAAGPWLTSAHAVAAPIDVPRGGVRTISTEPYTGRDYSVSTSAEILHVQPEGHVRMASNAQFDEVVSVPLLLCVAGQECACPAGMHDTGPTFIKVSQPLLVGLTGAVGGARLVMKGESFRDRCEPDASPRASGKPAVAGGHRPPRCGKRCASSNGDPHMLTIDGSGYNFQAAGEFTLLSTPDGSVDIQVRQEPAGGVELGSVSNNTALAVRLGDHRVATYATPDGLELRVDGVTQSGTPAIDIAGGRIERFEQRIVIDLPDGTTIWVISMAPYGLNALIDPTPSVLETGVGLLGRTAPGLGVPRLPDGTALPKPLDRHEAYAALYQRFADAWRVTDTTTLFDYDPGKSTASYTNRDYPSPPKVATFEELDPAKAAAGRTACAAVADAALQVQCAFDVAVTGDTGYVRPYKAIEQVVEHGSVAPDVAAASPSDTPAAVANAPVEVLPVMHQLAGAALGPDGTLYLSVVTADRTGRVLAIDPVTGQILQQVDTTGAGEVAVAGGSVWVGEFSAPATGGFQPCSVSRLDAATLAVQATIPTACHRVWSRTDFAAVGDDVWFVDPSTADATGAGASLRRIDTATNAVAGPAIPLPFADGTLRASATALFYGEATKGQFRLRPGETALTPIGPAAATGVAQGYPAGDGLWADANGEFALYTSAGAPDGTLNLHDADGGVPVAADAASVYVERTAAGGGNELWRRYLDGRVPARIAVTPPTVETGFGPTTLSYFDAALVPTFLVGDTSVAKVWVAISREDPAESLLLVQGGHVSGP